MCDLHGTGLELGEGANNESLIGKVFITHVDTSSWLPSILVFSRVAGAQAICRQLHVKNRLTIKLNVPPQHTHFVVLFSIITSYHKPLRKILLYCSPCYLFQISPLMLGQELEKCKQAYLVPTFTRVVTSQPDFWKIGWQSPTMSKDKH